MNDEMYIIVRDIKDHTRWMNAALWRPWLRSVAVGVCLFLGILAGSWSLTRWYANHIQSLIETRRALEFAILPESTPENPLLTMDGRPTVRLSSE